MQQPDQDFIAADAPPEPSSPVTLHDIGITVCVVSGPADDAADQPMPRLPELGPGVEMLRFHVTGPAARGKRRRPSADAIVVETVSAACRKAFHAARGKRVVFVGHKDGHGLNGLAAAVAVAREETAAPDGGPAMLVPGEDDRFARLGDVDLEGKDISTLLDRPYGKVYLRRAAVDVMRTIPARLDHGDLSVLVLNLILLASAAGSATATAWPVALMPDAGGGKPPATLPLPEDMAALVDMATRFQARFHAAPTSLFPVKAAISALLHRKGAYDRRTVQRIEELLSQKFAFRLRRIVMLTPDLSSMGGIQSRTRKVLRNAIGRDVDYVGISLRNEHGLAVPNNLVWDEQPETVARLLETWNPAETVVLFANNVLRIAQPELAERARRFPLMFLGSGQLSYLIQDSSVMADLPFVESLKATRILLLSRMDQNTYDQFGIHGHERVFHPVEVRAENTYAPEKNRYVGYVGRIDYYAKAADRLIEAAIAIRDAGIGPLRIFTVSSPRNSPQLDDFLKLLADNDLLDSVDITYDVEDKDIIYGELSLLLLPSKKDSFPNVVLEANSYGIPVVAMSYAPGPSETIEHGRTGFLLDRFSSDALAALFRSLDRATLASLSQAAFEKHRQYGMDTYFELIERIGNGAVNEFGGTNLRRVYPDLVPVRQLTDSVDSKTRRIEKLRARHASEIANWEARLQRQRALRKTEIAGLSRQMEAQKRRRRTELAELRQKRAEVSGLTRDLAARKAESGRLSRQLLQEKRSRAAEVAALKKSLSYRIGAAVVRNARSPIGWLKMPWAIFKAARAYRKGRK